MRLAPHPAGSKRTHIERSAEHGASRRDHMRVALGGLTEPELEQSADTSQARSAYCEEPLTESDYVVIRGQQAVVTPGP
jgi:hypothetical protein